MSDDFDLDDMLNDTLNNTVPADPDDLLDDLTNELLGPSAPESKEIKLQYSELSYLPVELQKQWESIISKDEAVMRSRKSKKLSNAYNGVESKVKNLTVQELFSMLLNSVLTNYENGEEISEKMSQDPRLVELFRKELQKKLTLCVDKHDPDVIKGGFPHMKHVLNL